MSKKILLTGGGTAGHVTPNLALVPELKDNGYEICYVGSYNGIEKKLVEEAGVDYYGISSGKLRRHLTFKNVTDAFRVLKGIFQAKKLLKKLKPDIVFSKGGFVVVPVVFAAKSLGIPVVIHESDLTPGLANRLAIPKANKVCCSFEKTLQYLPENKRVLTGLPIRKEILSGNKQRGLECTGFNGEKQVLLVMGGSLGAVAINNVIYDNIDKLLEKYDVVHICGSGNKRDINKQGYVCYEYLKENLPDILALADIIVSRAGANSICEIAALNKLNILIPLTKAASRGDQILNAQEFEKQGYSYVIQEENLNIDVLLSGLDYVMQNKEAYLKNMQGMEANNCINKLMEIFNELA